MITDILKNNNVVVILSEPHSCRNRGLMWINPIKPEQPCKSRYSLPFARMPGMATAAAYLPFEWHYGRLWPVKRSLNRCNFKCCKDLGIDDKPAVLIR
jgi:hypothetical protein